VSPQSAPVIFAGGGTGGHLFPGIAIAEVLKARDSARVVVFACSQREIDARILKAQTLNGRAIDFRPNPGKPFGLKPRALLRFIGAWGGAVRHGRGLIGELRLAAGGANPAVVAMGGFVAAPLVQAARAERCRVLMMNLDAVPGRANRWIAGRADRILTTAAVPNATWTRIPPIVRSAAHWPGTPAAARSSLGLDPEARTLFVTGASQGATSLNRLVMRLVADAPQLFQGWQIIHQTGPSDTADAKDAYAAANIRAVVEPFFDVMGPCWGAADCGLARAGAGSVAEAWANRVPTLFMPYPYHADQHQRANAQELFAAGGAEIADDLIDPIRNASGAAGAGLRTLLSDGGRRAAMSTGLASLGPADGALIAAAAINEIAL